MHVIIENVCIKCCKQLFRILIIRRALMFESQKHFRFFENTLVAQVVFLNVKTLQLNLK